MSIKEELQQIIHHSLTKLDIKIEINEIAIEIPKNKDNGNYSSNIALLLAKKLHQNPLQLSQKIKDNIESDIISNIEVANPGFINFFISNKYLYNVINEIITKEKNYGKNNIGNNQKVNIEFVSVNPTGTMHVGHARGATYGDNLSRIMTFCGFNVTKEYYINDAGNQMNLLGQSIKERYKELCNVSSSFPKDGYHGKEIVAIAKTIYQEYKTARLTEDNDYFKQYGLEVLLNDIKKDLINYRVYFDVWTSEQSLYDKGIVDDILTKLKNSGYCYIDEEALWLKTTEFGDDKDRVLIKKDGTYTYCVPDIAYHYNKYKRNYDELITVLGSDHHGSLSRVKAGLKILNLDTNKLDYRLLQMVRIIKDNEELKLSKRTGKTITLNDLVDEIGINATRYFFSSRNIDTPMDLNIDIALKQTNDNPIYYIEYANARICSILKKAHSNKIKIVNNFTTLENEQTYHILNKLNDFCDIIKTAALKRNPSIITNYIYELATIFHNYYANEQIITEDLTYTSERITLLTAIKIVINNSLDLIGIIPREEM